MATTQKQRQQLILAGMVRVDGLWAQRTDAIRSEYRIRHRRTTNDTDYRGRWDNNNGKLVIYTSDGEVWLGTPPAGRCAQLLSELCPKGQGAFVPCSNGEYLFMNDLLHRLADPDWPPS